jgi:hypothetical protein
MAAYSYRVATKRQATVPAVASERIGETRVVVWSDGGLSVVYWGNKMADNIYYTYEQVQQLRAFLAACEDQHQAGRAE